MKLIIYDDLVKFPSIACKNLDFIRSKNYLFTVMDEKERPRHYKIHFPLLKTK